MAFESGSEDTQRWISRFAGSLRDFRGAKVLDVGCGLGSTCFYMAEAGARHVVGIDVVNASIEFVKSELSERHPHLRNRVEFYLTHGLLEGLPEYDFDLVVSQDAFEHIGDPEAMVAELVHRVAPEGQLVW